MSYDDSRPRKEKDVNASKENATKMANVMARQLTALEQGKPPSVREMMEVFGFLQAVARRLPSEAAIERDRQKRRNKRQRAAT